MSPDLSRFLTDYSRKVAIIDFHACRKLKGRGSYSGSDTSTAQPERRGRGALVRAALSGCRTDVPFRETCLTSQGGVSGTTEGQIVLSGTMRIMDVSFPTFLQ
jgi:hypothetical protein